MHHHGGFGRAHGHEPGLAGHQREFADPKADDGAVHRVVLSIPSREGDVQRAADEAEDAIRRIACQKNPLVLDESAELGDGAQPGARRFRALANQPCTSKMRKAACKSGLVWLMPLVYINWPPGIASLDLF
jgi:hypothetical protein